MNNCPKCNEPLETGTKFCPKCGCPLETYRDYSATADCDFLNFKPANLPKRFVASLLDGTIQSILMIPTFICLGIVMASLDQSSGGSGVSIGFVMFGIFMYVVAMAYGFIKDGLGNGQSWGKKFMNIKVIKIADSSKCSKGTSALRYLITLLINCIPLVGPLIEPIMVLSTKDSRRLADKAAGTMVVEA